MILCSYALGCNVPTHYFTDALCPVFRAQYWYLSSYFLLFFFMPLINLGVKGLSKTAYLRLLVAIFVFVCGYSCFDGCSVATTHDRFHLHHGYSFVWLAIVYIVGAYIRLHCKRALRPSLCIIGSVGLAFLSAVRPLLAIIVGRHIPGDSFVLVSYTSPFTFGSAILIFLACLNLNIRNSRVVGILRLAASCSFGVYLIHVQPFAWVNIWIPTMRGIQLFSFSSWLVFAILVSLATVCVFGIAEYLRIRVFQLLHINYLVKKIDQLYIKKSS